MNLELTSIAKTFGSADATVDAVKDATVTFPAGSYSTISGRSGSGKSTLLSILGLLESPSAGSYRVGNQPVVHMDDRERSSLRATTFGFILQDFLLLPNKSAVKNVEMPMEFGREPRNNWSERAAELLDRVGLSHRTNSSPTSLSGGEKQRVCIARALANDPSVLLADEPTGNLDTSNRDSIMRLLEQLNEDGMTLIIVTHDPELVKRSENKLVMKDGQLTPQN